MRDDWTADVDAMAAAVGPNTVLVVGSAPQYPQGVVDPIPEIAALAATVDANCHVDACMGGFVLPFAELLGRDVPPWDFRVDGVHSISADVHKLGYAPKGVSVIVHRTKQLRAYQTFVFDGWLGGLYASPNLQGTRSGLPMAAAWAVMQHLGVDGYVELTRGALDDGRPDAGRGRRRRRPARARRRRPAPRDDRRRPRRRRRRSTCSPSATRCGPGLAARPPGPARLAALDGQQLQRRRHRRVAGRPRRRASPRSAATAPPTARRPTPPSNDGSDAPRSR